MTKIELEMAIMTSELTGSEIVEVWIAEICHINPDTE